MRATGRGAAFPICWNTWCSRERSIIPGQDLARKVQERGGHWNAYTSVNRTVYYIDGPADSWQIFLNLLTELVFFPTFPEDELEREKGVVRREMAMYADDPDSVAYQLLMQTLYLKHPRRWPVLGEPAAFDCLTRQDVLITMASRYVPNNVVLSIAGDVDAAEIFSHLELLVEDLKSRPLNRELIPHEPHQFGSRRVRKEFAVPYSKLNLAWAPALFRPSGYAGSFRPGQHPGRGPFRAFL